MPILLWDVLAHSPSVGYDARVVNLMAGHSPRDLAAGARDLGPAELRTWSARGDISQGRWMRLASALLPLLDSETVELLHRHVPSIEPVPRRARSWARPVRPLPAVIEAHSMAQGRLGDCWLVAAMGAVAGRRPGYLESLVEELPNGCYRVRLFGHRAAPWRRRERTPVVVTGWLPRYGAVTNERGRPTRATVIEKAAASLFAAGSYPRLAFDFGGRAFGLIRGGFSPAIPLLPAGPWLAPDPRARSLEALRRALDEGHVAVASTLVRPGTARLHPREDEPARSVAIMNGHVYAVMGVGLYDEDGRGPGGGRAVPIPRSLPTSPRPPELRVHLRNPLGRRGSGGRETDPRTVDLFLSARQFRRAFLSLNIARP